MNSKASAACTNADPLIWAGPDYPTMAPMCARAGGCAGASIVVVHLPASTLDEAQKKKF